jgi:hypothetical protein
VKEKHSKHQVPFGLKGVPLVNQFIGRDTEIKQLEDSLLCDSSNSRRKVYVIHGLGGMGKTQLAIEFARKHHERYSAVFWLDGSSRDKLNQSLADVAQSLPQEELTADTVQELRSPKIDVSVIVKAVLLWLSLPSNRCWLLIFDNIDRDHTLQGPHRDLQAYDVRDFFPAADHGSIIITSRLSRLQRLRTGSKVLNSKLGTVNNEQAMVILENNANRPIKGK